MAWLNNIRMARKLIGSFVLVVLLAGIITAVGFVGMNTMQTTMDSITGDSMPGLVSLLQVKADVSDAMRYSRGVIMAKNQQQIHLFAGKADHARTAALHDFQGYYAGINVGSTTPEAVIANQTMALLQRWLPLEARIVQLAVQHTAASNAAAAGLSMGPEPTIALPLSANLNKVTSIIQQEVSNRVTESQTAHSAASLELLLVAALAIILALSLGIVLSRSIVRPLAEVQRAATSVATVCIANLARGMEALAQGNLTLKADVGTTPPTFQGRDEIGQTSEAVRLIISRVQATVASYETARAELQNLIGQVAHSAEQVACGSTQLSAATEQLGQASTQIARAIEDVAKGAGVQSESATTGLTQMTELTSITQNVAKGTAQQQTAIADSEAATARMRAALAQTTTGVAAVTTAADRAAQTAQEGGTAVGQTIASIDSVRTAVLKSAEQVAVLGQRSDEVGAIVKAIDEIAEQTNLLALNAAIEAARAGEHGKGFAVVAAEVRKLAERAGSETKEISARIAAIQTQVSDVVAAMKAGSTQVEQSATLGQQARSALQNILSVVDETRRQALAITDAVNQMTSSVDAVKIAGEHVAQIASQTTLATEQMLTSSDQVGKVMESIAAVSEQSAASAQEVSASTEEQSANVEEMAANAQSLAQLAASLQAVVARFVLEETAPSKKEASPTRATRLQRVA